MGYDVPRRETNRVAESRPKPMASDLPGLTDHLKSQSTVSDLFRLASSDAFKEAVYALPPADQDTLRQTYRECQISLDGKVKLDEYDDQILRVIEVFYWQTDRFLDKNPSGEGVTIAYHPESDLKLRRKSLTSSAPVVRFFNNLREQPSEEAPIRVHVKLVPVRDPKRAAEGQRIWSIRRLPMAGQAVASPF